MTSFGRQSTISNYKMEESAATKWIIQTLAGCAQREALGHLASEANTPTKVLDIVKDTVGDQQGLSALLTSFHGHQQRLGETVLEYARDILMLSAKVIQAKMGTVDTDMLHDHFVDGLHPPSFGCNFG